VIANNEGVVKPNKVANGMAWHNGERKEGTIGNNDEQQKCRQIVPNHSHGHNPTKYQI
jgi:hypothetical protein